MGRSSPHPCRRALPGLLLLVSMDAGGLIAPWADGGVAGDADHADLAAPGRAQALAVAGCPGPAHRPGHRDRPDLHRRRAPGRDRLDRLWARTLPATATVLPNQPGFDWARIAALPEVAALTRFPVAFGGQAQGYSVESTEFPLADDQMTRTIERPVILAGRLFNPHRADEVVVTPKFAATSGKHVGDSLTLELASVQQADEGYDGSSGAAPARPEAPGTHHRSDPQPVGCQLRHAQARPAASSRRPPCSPGTAPTSWARTARSTSTRWSGSRAARPRSPPSALPWPG